VRRGAKEGNPVRSQTLTFQWPRNNSEKKGKTTNEGFYYRTYEKAGETVERLAFQCSRCHGSVVSFEDEMKVAVWCCGERHLNQPVIQKSFLGSFFFPQAIHCRVCGQTHVSSISAFPRKPHFTPRPTSRQNLLPNPSVAIAP
jgi:hypothetical protein